MHFDCVNVNLLNTIMSKIQHFLLMKTINVIKLMNKYDIKSIEFPVVID